MKTKFFQKLLATGLTAALLVGTVVPAYTAEADTANVQEPSMELAYEDGIAEEVYLQNNDDAEGVFWYGLATQEEIKEEIDVCHYGYGVEGNGIVNFSIREMLEESDLSADTYYFICYLDAGSGNRSDYAVLEDYKVIVTESVSQDKMVYKTGEFSEDIYFTEISTEEYDYVNVAMEYKNDEDYLWESDEFLDLKDGYYVFPKREESLVWNFKECTLGKVQLAEKQCLVEKEIFTNFKDDGVYKEKRAKAPGLALSRVNGQVEGLSFTNNDSEEIEIHVYAVSVDDALEKKYNIIREWIYPNDTVDYTFENLRDAMGDVSSGTYKFIACAEKDDFANSEFVELENYSFVVEEKKVNNKVSVGVGTATGNYYFTDYPIEDYWNIYITGTYTDEYNETGSFERAIYDMNEEYYYIHADSMNNNYPSWEIDTLHVCGELGADEKEVKLSVFVADQFEITTYEEAKMDAPTLELYREDGQVKGIQITNNFDVSKTYIGLMMENENNSRELFYDSFEKNESKVILFKELSDICCEEGTYQFTAYAFCWENYSWRPETTLDYEMIVVKEDYSGETVPVYREENKRNYYISTTDLPENTIVTGVWYVSGDEWSGSFGPYLTSDNTYWTFYDGSSSLEKTFEKMSYFRAAEADEESVKYVFGEIPESKIQVVTKDIASKNVAILDYDYYMSFIASGGSVTFDSENAELKTSVENFKDQNKIWNLEGIVEFFKGSDVFGWIEYMSEYVLAAANKYWNCEEGSYEPVGFYDVQGNDISEDSISSHDIVLVKYEPEIVWVDSMELTAPKEMSKNSTGKVTVQLDAGQTKYPFKDEPQIRYASSNSSIVAVDPITGKLTAGNKDGIAEITAYADENMKEWCELTDIVTASVKIKVGNGVCVENVFEDVKESNWYTSYVQYVYDQGLMSGNNGLFTPSKNITRAQVITTLYRLGGSPAVTDYTACKELSDVKEGKYYTDAVCWAYNTGITTGNTATKLFNVSTPVTREQLSTFIYRFAGNEGLDVSVKGDISEMLNADQVGKYAKTAVEWAVGAGVISGSETTDAHGNVVYDLKPQSTATRAQMAAILQRFCEAYGF